MNRREFLVVGVGSALIVPTVDELKVVSHVWRRKVGKGYRCSTAYQADVLEMELNDGTSAQAWFDKEHVLNISGINSDDFKVMMNRGDVVEDFARKHYIVSH